MSDVERPYPRAEDLPEPWRGPWDYGDMYATPPKLHVCRRCGRSCPHIEAHDEWHDAVDAGEAQP